MLHRYTTTPFQLVYALAPFLKHIEFVYSSLTARSPLAAVGNISPSRKIRTSAVIGLEQTAKD